MPELSEILTSTLDGAVRAVDASERRHLVAQVQAIQVLAGREPTLTDLLGLMEEGWLPDFFAGTELEIAAQLAMTTARERQASGGGSVQLGPLQLTGSLSTSLRQATTTNVAVTIRLARQSRSQGLEYAIQALRTPNAPALPGDDA